MKNDYLTKNAEGWERIFKKGASISNFPHESLVTCYHRWMKDGMMKKNEPKVLDIGCGGAADLLFFLSEGIHYTGIDVTDTVFEWIKSRQPGHGKYYDLMLFTPPGIPFGKGSFDMVTGIQSIHLNPTEKDIRFMISEIHRVLKTGGFFFFTVFSKEHLFLKKKYINFLGKNIMEVKEEYPEEERRGMRYFFFNSKTEIREYFSSFSRVLVGKYLLELEDGKDFSCYVIYGKK